MDPVPSAIANDPNLSLLWQRQVFLAKQQQEILTRVGVLERRAPTSIATTS